jgi:gamma-butyrobetaine dioxygenase
MAQDSGACQAGIREERVTYAHDDALRADDGGGFSMHGVSRRELLKGGSLTLAAAALLAVRAGAAPAAGRDPVVEQIAELLGGWEFDQARGHAAWRAAGGPDDLPLVEPAARFFQRRSHALQTALQAEKAGASEAMVAAALLHDIGHGFAAPPPRGREKLYDDRHELVGAMWLRNVFVPEVSEPVLNHVPGKRYLIATNKAYWDHLAPDSKQSLMLQGGPMSAKEIEAFHARPFWAEGVKLRTWDDEAKAWETPLPPLERFVPALEASFRSEPLTPGPGMD